MVQLQLADELVQFLAGAELPEPVQVRRAWVPSYRAEELTRPVVTVVPSARARRLETRAADQIEAALDVGIHWRLASVGREDVDRAVRLAEAVEEAVRRFSPQYAAFSSLEYDPMLSPDHLDSLQVFLSVIRVVYTWNVPA